VAGRQSSTHDLSDGQAINNKAKASTFVPDPRIDRNSFLFVIRLGRHQVVVHKQKSQLHRLLAMLEWGDGEPNMTVEQAISDISALPPNDQLRIVQAIWDRLPAGVGTELTDSQRAELDRRWAAYKADPSTALSEEEFRERIRVARGR